MHASANTACVQALWDWGVGCSGMVYVGIDSKELRIMVVDSKEIRIWMDGTRRGFECRFWVRKGVGCRSWVRRRFGCWRIGIEEIKIWMVGNQSWSLCTQNDVKHNLNITCNEMCGWEKGHDICM